MCGKHIRATAAAKTCAIFPGVVHLRGRRKWCRSLRARSAVIKTQRILVNWRNMRIHRAPFRFPWRWVRGPGWISWPGWTSKRELKGATTRSALSLEPARAGLRGETRPYADVSSQPLRRRRGRQRGARTSERERDWREGRSGSERKVLSTRERRRELSRPGAIPGVFQNRPRHNGMSVEEARYKRGI